MRAGQALLLLAALAAAPGVRSAGTTVNAPAQFSGETFTTPALGFSRGSAAIAAVTNAPVQKFDEGWCDGCRGAPSGTALAGAVLFQNFYSEVCFACGYGKLALMARDAGAGGVLWFSALQAGHEVFVFQDRGNWDAAAGYPFLEIGTDVSASLTKMLDAGAVSLSLGESENPWIAFYAGPWIAVQVICGLLALSVLILGGRRLWHFGRRYWQEGQYQVAVAVLSIEAVNNALRLFYMAVDPAWSRQILPYGAGRMLLTISIPIGLMSAVLLFLAWNDMLTASYSLKASVFRTRKSQAIFVAVGALFIGADLTLGMLAAVDGRVSLSTYAAIIDGVFSLMVGVGIWVVGTRLLRTLSQFSSAPSGPASKASKSDGSKDGSKDRLRAPQSPHAESSREMSSYNNASGHGFESGVDAGADSAPRSEVESAKSSGGSRFNFGRKPKTPTAGVHGIASGGSFSSRANKDLRVRRLTSKIRLMALFLVLSAIVISIAGQNFVIFRTHLRAVAFVLYYLTQTLRSYFTIAFFEPTPRRVSL